THLSPFHHSFQDMEKEILAACGKGDPEEILSSAFKLKITREDIHTLRNQCWLNDEVINFYLGLVMQRSKKEDYPSVYAFSTFFLPKLTMDGYKGVSRWTRCVDIFKHDVIFVPINSNLHWSLVAMDLRVKSIHYFDSLGKNGDDICQVLLKYLQQEMREKRKEELDMSEWMLHSMAPHEIPQQYNGYDCGVFMCKYADYLSQDRALTFSQSCMPYFRKRMVWEILHQVLL
ncbi:SENP2 protease, partial [Turnix velox]|nr:SENP2 protease [Turnix velox]